MLYINIFSLLRIRQAAQVVMAIVVITSVYLICTIFTACIPLQSYWNMAIPHTYCESSCLCSGNLAAVGYDVPKYPMMPPWPPIF